MVAVTRSVLLKRPSPAIDTSIFVAMVCCCTALVAGCRSRAYEDVYQQRLQSEIRVLEDQLYEADYENRKLAEKLHRAKQRAAEGRPPHDAASDPPSRSPIFEPPQPEDGSAGRDREEEPYSLELDDDLMIDPGEAYDPGESVDPGEGDDELLPAPGGPQPPGERDLRIPPIEEGEPVPPPESGEPDDQPPGKIELDNALSLLGQTPDASPLPKPQTLRLQPAFSGGHHFDNDDQIDGLMLVVSVIDDSGNAVDLTRYEIAADLTVVALDPMREPADARLARWQFAPDELQQWVAARPVHGLHIPVEWQEKRPLGEQVAVHVRLKDEQQQLSCEATMPVEQPPAIAEWTPRGAPDS